LRASFESCQDFATQKTSSFADGHSDAAVAGSHRFCQRRNPPMSKIRHAAPSFELIQVLVFGIVITLVGFVAYLRV
jgi:hypothetical protein